MRGSRGGRRAQRGCRARGRRCTVRAIMKHTMTILAAALLSMHCKSELDGKPVAKVGEAKGELAAAASKPEVKTEVQAPGVVRTLKVDPTASSISFVGAKLTGDHKGDFKGFTGEATVAGMTPTSVRFSIDMDSVSSDADDLTTHLKSEDFFHVERHPKAEFATTAMTALPAKADDGTNYEVTGDLDLHGVKKSIVFPATITVDEAGAKGTAEFKINRKDFKIEYPGKPDDLIKDEVLLKLSLSFVS